MSVSAFNNRFEFKMLLSTTEQPCSGHVVCRYIRRAVGDSILHLRR